MELLTRVLHTFRRFVLIVGKIIVYQCIYIPLNLEITINCNATFNYYKTNTFYT